MMEPMSKARLLEILHAKRAEYDEAVAGVPMAHMAEPGAAGHWSIKDIVAHLTYYERWMADRMHEQLRGETYEPTPLDMMHWDQRNDLVYEGIKDKPLADVLADSQDAFIRLIESVAAHSEAFLLEPQQFSGLPQPILVWNMLRSEVYDHYGQHIPDIRAWAAAHS